MPLAPDRPLKARKERLNDEAFRAAEQGRLSRLNRQVTALQEAEEQRRLQDSPEYAVCNPLPCCPWVRRLTDG